MRAIAEAIEYSPTAIYYHFKDKEEMVNCLCREDFGHLHEAFRTAELPADPVERIRAIGRVYARFGLENPNHYRFLFLTPPPGHLEEPIESDACYPGEQAFGILHSAVRSAAEAGRLRSSDSLTIAQVLWATIHGAVALLITLPAEFWPEGPASPGLIDETIDNSVRGFLAEGPRNAGAAG